jgi:hypothetical protein
VNCTGCRSVAPLCDACLDQATRWLTGTAAARGVIWGRRVRRVADGDWPAYASERIRALAARKVADIAGGDRRLLDRLARACAAAARETYEADTPPVPGSVSFRVDGGKPSR